MGIADRDGGGSSGRRVVRPIVGASPARRSVQLGHCLRPHWNHRRGDIGARRACGQTSRRHTRAATLRIGSARGRGRGRTLFRCARLVATPGRARKAAVGVRTDGGNRVAIRAIPRRCSVPNCRFSREAAIRIAQLELERRARLRAQLARAPSLLELARTYEKPVVEHTVRVSLRIERGLPRRWREAPPRLSARMCVSLARSVRGELLLSDLARCRVDEQLAGNALGVSVSLRIQDRRLRRRHQRACTWLGSRCVSLACLSWCDSNRLRQAKAAAPLRRRRQRQVAARQHEVGEEVPQLARVEHRGQVSVRSHVLSRFSPLTEEARVRRRRAPDSARRAANAAFGAAAG